MNFKLSKYILPTVIAMVLVGTYTNIDGLFIGHVCGDDGLAAINIAWPIVAFITAVGTGIGVGGAVVVNRLRGEGHYEQGERAKYTALVVLAIAGAAVTLLCCGVYAPLLRLMGAQGQVLTYARNYSLVVSAGALFQIMGAGVVVLLRNDGKTVSSMVYTFVGLVLHILLDVLLVRRYALYGVAISTVLSQLVVMIAGLIHLPFKRDAFYGIKEIVTTSTAPFGVNFVSSLTLLFTNFFALRIGGTAAVSAYAVMSYAVYTYDYIFQGICDGTQPILSFTIHEHYKAQRQHTVKVAVALLGGLAVIFMLLTPAVSAFLPRLFSVSPEAKEMMETGLIFYAFSYIFKAGVKWMCAYSYSTKKLWISNILTYIDPLLFSPLCLVLLPMRWGINGIWLAMTVSQVLTMLVGVVLMIGSRRKQAKPAPAGVEAASTVSSAEVYADIP